MRKLLLLILLGISFNSFGQIATGVNNLQAFPWRTFSNPNMVGLVYDGSQYRMYGFDKYSLLDTTNATGKFGTKYDLSLKTNRSQTLSINGTTYDLSANRSWSVGDLLSSGSYSDPSWITSLAWSKITGTPTTISGYGITDAVTNASLSSALSSYATTSALTSGLSTKQNTLTLTTTGTGVATLGGDILNIPTPSIPAQYNPTAGTGISISGTYPNQTITNTAPYTAPTISTPTMVLGTSYQAPSNKNVWVNASITHTIALTLVLTSGSSLVQLQTSPNNSTWTTINSAGFSDAVAIAVSLTKTVTNNVSGEVPPNYYYRLIATTSGAGSAAITNQQLKTY